MIKIMNRTRKLTLILLAIIVICLCLTGCGKKDKNPVSVNNEGNGKFSQPDVLEYITYFLRPIVSKSTFELYLYVPDDYPIEITHFELWTDKQRVGERTSINETLRHLELSIENIDKMWIRLYNTDEFVADCEIDPTLETDSLIIDLSEDRPGSAEQ